MRDSWLYSLPVQHFNILGNLFVLEQLHTFLPQNDKNYYFSTPYFHISCKLLVCIFTLLFDE